MSERSHSLSAQVVNPSQRLPPPSQSAASHDASPGLEHREEEPYTIKCICGFSDDDGNTIYCETCDTWQHIECYYPHNLSDALREDFAHNCAECKPRTLDKFSAMERQRIRLSMVAPSNSPDKKTKRPPSKSHKKKPKPTDLQLNGNGVAHEHKKHGSPQLNSHPHPPKKLKTSHKANPSISSQGQRRSPGAQMRMGPNGHPPSPATTPPDLPHDFEIHGYTDRFLSLYDDNDVQITQENSFANLTVSNRLSLWQQDRDQLRRDVGHDYNDVFQPVPANLDTSKLNLRLESKKMPMANEQIIKWQYLTTPAPISKDVPLMELNGQIGFQKDYCVEPEHRWEELTSPLPFVFFHPVLPLSIDTRREGSLARYVRRSCKPNTQLDTYIFNGKDYHFWLVSDRAISAAEQITLPWDFRFPNKDKARTLRLLGIGDEDVPMHEEADMDQEEYSALASFLYSILSEYGGCACGLGDRCAFAQFHRNHHAREYARMQQAHPPKKRPRKPKTHNLSPTSTGQATNSRAASEHVEENGVLDTKSETGSAHSKGSSRENTPPRQGSFDQLGILTEPTDRDKRKVQMLEDSFRKLEQQAQPPRKKKRISDGSGSSKSTKRPGFSSEISNSMSERGGYVDAGTSHSKSGSPTTAMSPNSGSAQSPAINPRLASTPATAARSAPTSKRPNYADSSTQTDPEPDAWYNNVQRSPSTKPRRRVVSLSQRLLHNRHMMKVEAEAVEARRRSLESGVGLEGVTQTSVEASVGLQSTPHNDGDTPMQDAAASSPTTASALPNGVGHKGNNPLDLKVQLPPVPNFTNATSSSAMTTPLVTNGSILQSPFNMANGLTSPFPPTANGIVSTSSPVKKKMSLKDWRKSKGDASKPAVAPGPKTTPSLEDGAVVKPEATEDKMAVDELPAVSPITEAKAEAVNGAS